MCLTVVRDVFVVVENVDVGAGVSIGVDVVVVGVDANRWWLIWSEYYFCAIEFTTSARAAHLGRFEVTGVIIDRTPVSMVVVIRAGIASYVYRAVVRVDAHGRRQRGDLRQRAVGDIKRR